MFTWYQAKIEVSYYDKKTQKKQLMKYILKYRYDWLINSV